MCKLLLYVFLVFLLASAMPIQAHAEKRDALQLKREEVKTRIEERNANLEKKRSQTQEAVQTKRAGVKEKIQAFRDEKRKAAATRLFDKLQTLNSRTVDHFTAVLNR